MGKGWIALYRQIQDHYFWEDKPFTRGQAWVDLLLSANHADNKFLLGNTFIEVERGSLITSEQKLMDRWGWSKTKVRSFLQVLEKDSMIVKKTDKKKTTINIVNYSVFQDLETTERPEKDHRKTTKKPQKDLNNNENNDEQCLTSKKKPVRHKHGQYENVMLTDAELEKLKSEFPQDWQQRIETLSEAIASKGYVYKNHLATIRVWARRENKGVSGKDAEIDRKQRNEYQVKYAEGIE